MIVIKGQYFLKFTIGTIEDNPSARSTGSRELIVSIDDFKLFTIVEEAGNVLPTFVLIFDIDDESVMEQLNEGNPIVVGFGENSEEMEKNRMTLVGSKIHTSGSGPRRRRIEVTGVLNALDYLSKSVQRITKKIKPMEAMKLALPSSLEFDGADTETEKDEQYWIQPNISNKRWVNDLWLHMNIPGSFPLVGITADGKFRVRDVKKLVQKKVDWVFLSDSPIPPRAEEIIYYGVPVINQQNGFINSWFGYGRKKDITEIETGEEKPVEEAVPFLGALVEKGNRNSAVGQRFDNRGAITDNVHPAYWSAFQRNLASLAVYSTVKVSLSFDRWYQTTSVESVTQNKLVRVLDLVSFLETSTDPGHPPSWYTSGTYIVTKVSRTLAVNSVMTFVEFTREAWGSQKGDLV